MKEDYVDQTSAFWETVQALEPEQIVASQGFTLQRLMNALEVMDPNMDAGMAFPPALIDRRDRVPAAFHVAEQLSVHELCFVLDRVFALELEWMEGAALGQTLYTCEYFHRYVVPGTPASAHWTHQALSVFLLATAKCCALQYHELMRQHVLDAEDFCGDPGGVGLPDGVDPATVVTQLDAAMHRAYQESPDSAASVCVRLAMKKYWLGCLTSLSSPVPDGVRAGIHLDGCLRQWKLLKPGQDKILALQSPYLVDAPEAVQGDGHTAAGGTRELEHVAFSAVEHLSGVVMHDILVRLEWAQQRDPASSIATRTARFLNRFAGLLVQLLSTLLMNRARQKRMFAKAFPTWADLADDARQLDHDLGAALAPQPWTASLLENVVYFFRTYQQIHTIGAGFDLELYAEHEWGSQYYLLAAAFAEHASTCAQLLATPGHRDEPVESLQRWVSLASAQAQLCSAYAMLYLGQYGEPGLRPDAAAYAEAAFARRVKWLRRPAWSPPASLRRSAPSDPYPIRALWQEWIAYATAFS
ncbi:N-alpha-acetyltransferase, non-catalitic subunit [Malassezia obtusa]|uniref:N-alpha-acetyltransferase, non-catalitic subunit n=1 Tax=Malassezia obtusa TaxID=76774 RepID=A0AAF0E0N2_9BASI|nr:N-alpha-acetyltransferase, non-catalitic subunit [Malassezia obtusa]